VTPQEYIEARLGSSTVVLEGKNVDLADEVALPADDAIEDQLREHPARAAVWRRIRARAVRAKSKLLDELKELESVKFLHYYRANEEQERQEWARFHGDEDGERDAFGRRQAARERIARGDRSGPSRWRRNFSDDLVWAYVRSDDEVLEKRKALRAAAAQVELSEVLCEAMDHRARCLSHLAALHRDLGKGA